jgi:hypothetical protein
MLRRILTTLLLLAPAVNGLAGSRTSHQQPAHFESAQEEIEWLDVEIKREIQTRRSQEARAKQYEREADRLLFIDHSYTRINYRRAEAAKHKALEAIERLEQLRERLNALKALPSS